MSYLEINNSNQTPMKQIAAFDLDYTLIRPKSNRKFPKDKDDWKFVHDKIPEILRQVINKKYYLVIFTNQKGLKLTKTLPI